MELLNPKLCMFKAFILLQNIPASFYRCLEIKSNAKRFIEAIFALKFKRTIFDSQVCEQLCFSNFLASSFPQAQNEGLSCNAFKSKLRILCSKQYVKIMSWD